MTDPHENENPIKLPSVVIGGIFLARYELFGMEELPVGAGSDFVYDRGFQIDENGAWNVLSGAGLGEERVERIVTATDGFV